MYPFIFIFLLFSRKKMKFFLSRLSQDFSFLNKEKRYIWIHCSSVGEINLTDALIKKIRATREENILITTFTDTGYNAAVKKYINDRKINIYKFPLDGYMLLRKIFKNFKFTYLILIETELWPNLISLGSKYSKVILVNGRISDRSFPKYMKFKFILKFVLKKISIFCMQSDKDCDKIERLGAKKDRIHCTGNLKFDVDFEEFSDESRERLREVLKVKDRKLLVAGSTRTGEYSILLESWSRLKDTLLVIVPRHLDRVCNVEDMLSQRKIEYVKFSTLEKDSNMIWEKKVVIVDKIGILRKFYSIADYTFVGGTLVNIGGHNLLEPLFYKKTPIFGPYLQNVKDISEKILELNIGFKVENCDEFIQAIENIEDKNVNYENIDKLFKENRDVAEAVLKFLDENKRS